MHQVVNYDYSTHHFDAFKLLVNQHVTHEMSTIEYNAYREASLNKNHSFMNASFIPNALISLKELLDIATCEEGLAVNELINSVKINEFKIIGNIDNQPVYFLNGKGVYFWGEAPDSLPIISVWLTFPAYPPNW